MPVGAVESVRRTVAALSPRSILVIGWLGFMVYAYPGLMSFDSVLQLKEARTAVYSDWHPPAMAALWRIVECVIAGPVGMLVLQSTTFLAGTFLVLRRHMSPRTAALVTSLILWFPPIGTTVAVIWKDSQMLGYVMLGTAWMLSERRRVRLAGLALLCLGSMMRYNAMTITLPLVVLLFVWEPRFRGWRRYAIATAAWLAITVTAQQVNAQLPSVHQHVWESAVAPVDIVGTLRYTHHMSDAELRELLAGTPLVPQENIKASIPAAYSPANFMVSVFMGDTRFFNPIGTDEQRAAIKRVWREVVFHHPIAYLRYRWDSVRALIQLTHGPHPSHVYMWFTDIQNPDGSAEAIQHDASASWIQARLIKKAGDLGSGWMFRPFIYLFILLALTPLWLRDRELLAFALSALISEAALFVVTVTSDFRYSLWLVFASVVVIVTLIAKRGRRRLLQTADPQVRSDEFASLQPTGL